MAESTQSDLACPTCGYLAVPPVCTRCATPIGERESVFGTEAWGALLRLCGKQARTIDDFTRIGRQHGYAIAVHGSLGRDLDLVAIPWVDEADKPASLVAALQAEMGLHVKPTEYAVQRPHGRLGYIFHGRRQPVDLSVVDPDWRGEKANPS